MLSNIKFVLIIGLFLFLTTTKTQGQNVVKKEVALHQGSPYVKWVKQFPIPKNEQKPIGIFRSIGKFFFGKPQITLNKPISVIAASPDSMLVLDQGNGKIIQIIDKTATLYPFITKARLNFSSLLGACFVSNNEFLFTESRLNQLYYVNTDKKKLKILNDSLKLQQPTGVAYSNKNNEIWVVETAAHRISILNKKGELIKRIGKRGTASGEFNFPTFIWIDKSEYVYVVDAMNFRIQIFDIKGNFVSSFGKIGDGSGSFASPKGIATDTFGNIYIADALFHVVQIFDKSGNFLYQFGSQGHKKEQFWMPTGIFIDKNNYIYVADSYNSRIQVFQLMTP